MCSATIGETHDHVVDLRSRALMCTCYPCHLLFDGPDVEALLVHDDDDACVVPIDVGYELVGRLRKVWRGFDGGREAREDMSRFFTRVRERSAT
ncbi:MAG TPA: DUF5947 family protein [Actinoplanes sp.]